MKYEISDDDFRTIKSCCMVTYAVLEEESAGVRSGAMQEIQVMFNRLEAQRGEAQEDEQEPAPADVPEAQGVLVFGDFR